MSIEPARTSNWPTRIGGAFLSLPPGALAGYAIAGHANTLGCWPSDSAAFTAAMAALTLICWAATYWLLFVRVSHRMAGRSIPRRCLWLFACLAAGALLTAATPIPKSRPLLAPRHTLEIIALGKANPQARGMEVWFHGVRDGDGNLVALNEFEHNNTWELRGATLLSFHNQPAKLSWRGRVAPGAKLRLEAHPWSGMVQITWDGEAQVLAALSPGRRSVALSLSPAVHHVAAPLEPEAGMDLISTRSSTPAIDI